MVFNIVLVEPEIPQNTGNIIRTCAVTGSTLHLVGPLGFSMDDRHLKRAGLDYWHLVDIRHYDSYNRLRTIYPNSRFYFATTKAGKFYDAVEYRQGDFLVFGKETKGLPKGILEQNPDNCIRIPMVKETAARSINLSNAVAVVLYEALRQHKFTKLT